MTLECSYYTSVTSKCLDVRIFKEEGRGGSGESANNCALFEFRINVPYYYIAYYKLFIFEYHRPSTLLKRNVLGDMTCTLTTQSKSDDDLLCKS